MSLALTDDHRQLAEVARNLLNQRDVLGAARESLDAADDRLPAHWDDMRQLGWFGLHLPESAGGQGFGMAELAIVLYELGYAVAPGPFLPTVIASTLLHQVAPAAHGDAIAELASGSLVAGLGLDTDLSVADGAASGSAGLVLGAELAGLFLLAHGDDVLAIPADAEGVVIEPVENLDTGRRAARVTLDQVAVGDGQLSGARRLLERAVWALGATEAAGTARACTDMATAYARERQQFGRVIGSFQAVKHLCADMFVASEQAIAASWGAARDDLDGHEAEIGAAIAATVALPAAVLCAENGVQVLGGIGFTWEHDAHLYLRRAHATRALLGGADAAAERVADLSATGVVARTTFDVPESESVTELRREVREFIAGYEPLTGRERRKAVADAGLLMPHWPAPYGRNAGPIEQLVIDEEFAGVERPNLGISGWNTLTILQNGTPDQIERWIWPSLHGDLDFCQLYSEPEAGSDAAGVRTRAERVDGGWKVTGQKVWTSGGHTSNRGFATVRTNPDAPKHQGITMMVIDMAAEGVDIRPLKQITGHSHFCEIFFDEVFVPDDDVVGPVDGGWSVARSNLGNERVSIGARAGAARAQPDLSALLQRHESDVGMRREAGELIAADASSAFLNLRRVVRAVEGSGAGAEGNVTKLVNSVTNQRRARLAARIAGTEAATFEQRYDDVGCYSLFVRQNSIAGGTSEVIRNVIGERVLGLPREPLLS